MELSKLIRGLKVEDIKGNENIDIANIEYDSRKVKENSLFVCIDGFKTDGHKYIATALKNGAVALLVQREVENYGDATVIKVKDTRSALANVASEFFNNPSETLNIIGVTGTKGKSTTTFMLKTIFEAAGQKTGLIGTIVNSIGDGEIFQAERTTPESIDLQYLFNRMLKKDVKNVVMEVSSHALELHRASCIAFNIGIFTNLTREHMDFHENFEDYFAAKAKLFDMSQKAIINIDNEYGPRLVDRCKCECYTFSIDNPNSDFRATDIVKHQDSVDFRLISKFGEDNIRVNIPGVFSVYNALGVIAASLISGIKLEDIKKGLANVSVPGRAEVVYAGKDFSIVLDYAHTPDSLENIINTIKDYTKGRVVCLFGCGGDRDKSKRPIMGEISGKLADFTVITSDNPRTENPANIISDIEQGIKRTSGEYIIIEDRYEAIKYCILNAKPKDTIILAGKGHEKYQIFADKTIHFDEKEIVNEILKLEKV